MAKPPKYATEEFSVMSSGLRDWMESGENPDLYQGCPVETAYRVIVAATGEVIDDNNGYGYPSPYGITRTAGRRWEEAQARLEAEAQLAAAVQSCNPDKAPLRFGTRKKGQMKEAQLKRALKNVVHYCNVFGKSLRSQYPTLSNDKGAAGTANEIYSNELLKALNDRLRRVSVCELVTSAGSSDALREGLDSIAPGNQNRMPAVHDRRSVCVGRVKWNYADVRAPLAEYWMRETYIDENGNVFYVDAKAVSLGGPGGLPRAVYRKKIHDGCFAPSLNLLVAYLPDRLKSFWEDPPEGDSIA